MFVMFRQMANSLKTFGCDKRGGIALVYAIAFIVLVGATGSAIDFGRALHEKSAAQAAIDGAVLAGVQKKAA